MASETPRIKSFLSFVRILSSVYLIADLFHKFVFALFAIVAARNSHLVGGLNSLKGSHVFEMADEIFICWILALVVLTCYLIFLILLLISFRKNPCSIFSDVYHLKAIKFFFFGSHSLSYICTLLFYIKLVETTRLDDLETNHIPLPFLDIKGSAFPHYYHPCLDYSRSQSTHLRPYCNCSQGQWEFNDTCAQQFFIYFRGIKLTLAICIYYMLYLPLIPPVCCAVLFFIAKLGRCFKTKEDSDERKSYNLESIE